MLWDAVFLVSGNLFVVGHWCYKHTSNYYVVDNTVSYDLLTMRPAVFFVSFSFVVPIFVSFLYPLCFLFMHILISYICCVQVGILYKL